MYLLQTIVINFLLIRISHTRIVADISSFEDCPRTASQTAVSYSAEKFRIEYGLSIVNYNITVKHDLPDNLQSLLLVRFCGTKEKPAPCNVVHKFQTKNMCKFFRTSGLSDSWMGMYSCLRPKYFCPIKENLYVGKNCKLDLSSFHLFPLPTQYIWNVSMSAVDLATNKRISCLSVVGYIKII